MSLPGNMGNPWGNNFQSFGRRAVNSQPVSQSQSMSLFPFAAGMMDAFSPLFGGLDLSHADANKVNVVEIDDFTPEKDQVNDKGQFFNHGETVASILQSGGSAGKLDKDIAVNKVNIDFGEAPEQRSAAISNALSKVINTAMLDRSKVDVVNLSQQDAEATQNCQIVRQKIKMLQDMGIPVVVAADNLGHNTPNQLAYNNAFVVQSTDEKGKLQEDSGPGNVNAVGRSTSFAAPQLAPIIGYYKKQGYSIDQIHQLLQNQGNFFSGAKFDDVFTSERTV